MRRSPTRQVNVWRNKSGTHIRATFAWCLLFAVLLVFGTWNPIGYSYSHWATTVAVQSEYNGISLVAAIVGLTLLLSWLVVIKKATKHFTVSIVIFGVVCILVAFALAVHYGELDLPAAIELLTWAGLFALSLIVAIILSGQELQNLNRRLRKVQRR